MEKLNRRNFISISTLTAATFVCQACFSKKTDYNKNSGTSTRDKISKKINPNEGMTRQEIMMMLDQRVNNYMAQSHHCAQTSFLALSEQFGLEDKEILKALTPLPGMAEHGQTCGVVTGSLMLLGLVYGRDRLDDWQKYRDSLIPTGKFVDEFNKEMGSTLCCDIVEKEFGQKLNLLDPADHAKFVAADATSKCSNIVRKGVRIAAEIILEKTSKS
jgi:C_GCAxxG_C_C family probable redox protein